MRPSQMAKTRVRKRKTRVWATVDFLPILGAAIMVLIVVMIAEGMTPHHSLYVDLALASSAIAEPKAVRENAMTVMVARDGSVYFRNVKIRLDDLPNQIREAVRGGAEKRLYLKVDARTKYGDVKAVENLIDEAGIRDVTFLVDKRVLPAK